MWDSAAFVGSTHVTAAERTAVAALLEVGLVDLHPRALKGEPFTYWDYRAGNFHKGLGMRIDLVLLSRALDGRVSDAYVDREARKGKAPSDHAPVVVEPLVTKLLLSNPLPPCGRVASLSDRLTAP